MSGDLRAGVVGLGFGANHARVLVGLPGVCLAAVADVDAARLDAYPDHIHTYESCEAMLASEDLDAVVIAVPASLHTAAALAAIDAGCAVLVEKPLAPSHAEAATIVEAAASRGVVLMPGHIERFNPALIELRHRLDAGEIGRVLQLTARRMSATRAGEHGSRLPPTDVNVIHDSALHDIDIARCLTGGEVDRVFAVAHSGLVTPAEDSVSAVLVFHAGPSGEGPVASLEVNWLAPRRVRDLTVVGERGMFLLDYAAQSLQQVVPGGDARDLPVARADQLVAELTAFVAAVREGARLPVTAEDGLAAVAVADALTRSARRAKVVTLEEVLP